MNEKNLFDRRTLLTAAGASAALAAAASIAEARPVRVRAAQPGLCFDNASFYDKDKKFQIEKAKDAILALCKHHGYPVFPGLRDKLWVSDYNTGEFTKVGLAAYMFCNNEEDRYMLMDLFLLPGQMLPEHWHEDGDKNPAKREGWLVRWGLSHIVGIGEPNLGKDVVVPKAHDGGKVSVQHETVATPGMFVKLAEVKTHHWQLAGPEGAIITEVANVHTDKAVRHADAGMNKFFLGE